MTDLNDIPKDVAKVTRDAAYVAIGLGVLSFQRAQVRRQALQRHLNTGDLDDVLVNVRTSVSTGVRQIDDIVEQAIGSVESALQPLEEQLPERVRKIADQAHSTAREVRGQIRQAVESAV